MSARPTCVGAGRKVLHRLRRPVAPATIPTGHVRTDAKSVSVRAPAPIAESGEGWRSPRRAGRDLSELTNALDFSTSSSSLSGRLDLFDVNQHYVM